MPDLGWVNQSVAAGQSFVTDAWERFPAPGTPPRIEYRRDGIVKMFERTEVLKHDASMLQGLYEEALRWRGALRSVVREVRAAEDDKVGSSLTRRVTEMKTLDMSFEERRIGHRTAAIEEANARRTAETVLDQIEGYTDALLARIHLVRQERNDLAMQTRQINVAQEIGEL